MLVILFSYIVTCRSRDRVSLARFRRNKFRLHPSHRYRGGSLPLTCPRVDTPAKLTLSPLYNGITYPLEIIFLILWATAIVANSAFTSRKAACSATFISGFDCADVKMLDDSIKYAYWIIFRDKVTDTVRKKDIVISHFKYNKTS